MLAASPSGSPRALRGALSRRSVSSPITNVGGSPHVKSGLNGQTRRDGLTVTAAGNADAGEVQPSLDTLHEIGKEVARQIVAHIGKDLVRLEELYRLVPEEGETNAAGPVTPLDGEWADRARDLQPLKECLAVAIQKETERHEKVQIEIESLLEEIRQQRDKLKESLEKHEKSSEAQEPSPYVRRRKLREMRAKIGRTIEEREEVFWKLREKWTALRAELMDLSSDEYPLPDADLSLTSLDGCIQVVQRLEEEKAARVNALAQSACSLVRLCVELGVTIPEPFLASLCSTVPEFAPEYATDEAIRTAISSRSEETMIAWPLSRDYLQQLRDSEGAVRSQYEKLLERLRHYIAEIKLFWEHLETPAEERQHLEENIKHVGAYKELADSLRTRWKSQMEETINALFEQLEELWDLCHTSSNQRDAFTARIGDTMYSPVTLQLLKDEVATLQLRYERYNALYKLMDARTAFLSKMREFEKTASDPKRLFRPSFQLVEEEKFRRTCVPTLLKMEETLRKRVAAMEAEDGSAFVVGGERFLERMAREVEGRFVNGAVFVLPEGATTTTTTGQQAVAVSESVTSPTDKRRDVTQKRTASPTFTRRRQSSIPYPPTPTTTTSRNPPQARRLGLQTTPSALPRRPSSASTQIFTATAAAPASTSRPASRQATATPPPPAPTASRRESSISALANDQKGGKAGGRNGANGAGANESRLPPSLRLPGEVVRNKVPEAG
ncbi:microtubule associated protein-domain-containing protein [Fimicolochytrium jonesii]|uniref:microtubule associated protein-domain-containing protein n=1 Tax=Fimicolochytrium jonesii TaxID=1396493 RepID=UPI0022FEF85B|nr:microtubule associated protein-domain-containing protein [Fimicolochytrium jonesii]KAI8824997.1 microtubule associated protein-domain-containing protein [Fimicolochytrium jonesii]